MKKSKEQFYKKFTEYLGKSLGPDYEIIVHSIENGNYKKSHVIALANGYVSGRNFDSPLTDLALLMIKNKEFEHSDYKINYKASTKSNKEIIGSTFFIKDEKGKLEGLLCINHDLTQLTKAAKDLITSLNIPKTDSSISKNQASEALSESIEDTIYSLIDPTFLNTNMILSPQQKENIIGKLYEKGVFSMKGSVLKVAKILKTSEPTIYRYLKNFK